MNELSRLHHAARASRARISWGSLSNHVSPIAMLMIFLGAVFAPAPALADHGGIQPAFDPSVCKEDAHGKLYVALGRNVLAIPANGFFVIQKIAPPPVTRDVRILPPDPTEPEGCPGNPQQDSTFHFPMEYKVIEGESSVPKVIHLRIEVYRTLDGDAVPTENDKEWMGELKNRDMIDLDCNDKARKIEELSNGFRSCVTPPRGKEDITPKEDWAGSYVANFDIYKTPRNKIFTISCSPPWPMTSGANCEIAYAVKSGLGLAYHLKLYGSPDAVPLDKVIEVDRSIRTQLTAMMIGNYAWPDGRGVTTEPTEETRP
jgi:hypothetical protein